MLKLSCVAAFVCCATVAVAGQTAAADKPLRVVAPAEVVWDDDFDIRKPLINERGKAFRGLEVFIDEERGNCVACHHNFDVEAVGYLGEIGPDLNWVGERFTKTELRAILVDSKRMFGDMTIMPAFYVANRGERVPEQYRDTTILTAQEVEDVIAYLLEMQR